MQWIQDRLKEIGRKQRGLASALRVSDSRITEIIQGTRQVKPVEMLPLANYLKMPIDEVLTRLSVFGNEGDLSAAATTSLRVRGAVEAGTWAEAVEWPEEDWGTIVVPKPEDDYAEVFALEVRGPSMNLEYPPGTYLICATLSHYNFPPAPDDHVIVRRRNKAGETEATVKELRRDLEGRWWLWPKSTHPDHQTPLAVPAGPFDGTEEDEVRVIAVVVGCYKRKRRPAALST